MINFETIKNAVSKYIQPLSRGIINKVDKDNVKMEDLIPFGTRDDFTNTSVYGVVSKTPKKVFGFFLNLFGNTSSPIILAHLDQVKPTPTKDGEVIFYCRKPNGTTFPVTLKFDPDGDLVVSATEKVKVTCKDAEITSETSKVTSTSSAEINSPNIKLVADTKVAIECDDIELGEAGLEKIVNGETFMTKFNNHPHIDFFGLPTNPPSTPMVEETDLSGKVKGAK